MQLSRRSCHESHLRKRRTYCMKVTFSLSLVLCECVCMNVFPCLGVFFYFFLSQSRTCYMSLFLRSPNTWYPIIWGRCGPWRIYSQVKGRDPLLFHAPSTEGLGMRGEKERCNNHFFVQNAARRRISLPAWSSGAGGNKTRTKWRD